MKVLGMTMLLVGMASILSASPATPEINPASAGSAVALLSGTLLVLKSRRKK
jgi:hypothetical protein